MVKRLVGAVAFAAVAAVVWVLFSDQSSDRGDDDAAVTSCVRGDLVDCVSFEAPVVAPASVTADSCKAWLSGDVSAATLSQCLHTTSVDRAKAEAAEIRRQRLLKTSS